jgi:hypothetical protein
VRTQTRLSLSLIQATFSRQPLAGSVLRAPNFHVLLDTVIQTDYERGAPVCRRLPELIRCR